MIIVRAWSLWGISLALSFENVVFLTFLVVSSHCVRECLTWIAAWRIISSSGSLQIPPLFWGQILWSIVLSLSVLFKSYLLLEVYLDWFLNTWHCKQIYSNGGLIFNSGKLFFQSLLARVQVNPSHHHLVFSHNPSA